MSIQILTVMFAKRRDPGVLWGRTYAQLAMMVGAGFCLVMAVRSDAGEWWWWILTALVLLVLGFGRVHGRPMAQVLPSMLADLVIKSVGAHVFRGGPYRKAAKTGGKHGGPSSGDQGPTVADLDEMMLPGVLSRLKMLTFEIDSTGDPVGVIKDRRDGTFTVVLQVEGDTFPLLSTDVANSHALAFQRMLDGLARVDSPLITLQLLHRVIPDHGDQVRREFVVRGGHGNADLNASYAGLVESEAGRGVRHESYVVMRMKPSKVKAAWKADGGGDAGAGALAYRMVTKMGMDLLACGVQVLGWLPPRGVYAVVRSAFDPASDAQMARRGGGRGDVLGGDKGLPSGVSGPAATPFYMQRATSYVAHNDHVSRMWWITEYPRNSNGVPVGFLQPLILNVMHRHSVSIILEPLPHRTANRIVDQHSSSLEAQRTMDRRIGRRRKRAAQREEADTDRRESELVEGFAVYRLSTVVSATCRNLTELEGVSELMESAMNECNMEASRWYVETDQAFAMSALPFARGLR